MASDVFVGDFCLHCLPRIAEPQTTDFMVMMGQPRRFDKVSAIAYISFALMVS